VAAGVHSGFVKALVGAAVVVGRGWAGVVGDPIR